MVEGYLRYRACLWCTIAFRSVLTHSDLSVLSFHATKVFNTFEGGAVVCPDGNQTAY